MTNPFTAKMTAYPGRSFGQLYHRFAKGNAMATGSVEIGDHEVSLAAITAPVLVFAGATDGIAPVEAVRAVVDVPLIASGGAGTVRHFVDAARAGADAVLAASVFHYGTLSIAEVKQGLAEAGFEVRTIAPRLAFTGLLSKDETTISFIGEGVDPEAEAPLSWAITVMEGTDLRAGGPDSVVLGEGLAANLGVHPGDLVVLLGNTPGGESTRSS